MPPDQTIPLMRALETCLNRDHKSLSQQYSEYLYSLSFIVKAEVTEHAHTVLIRQDVISVNNYISVPSFSKAASCDQGHVLHPSTFCFSADLVETLCIYYNNQHQTPPGSG